MSQMTGDPLCPITPEDNLLLNIDDAQAGRQAFQNAATDFGVVKGRHRNPRGESVVMGIIGKIHKDFREDGRELSSVVAKNWIFQ